MVDARYQQTRGDLQPYRDLGGTATKTLGDRLDSLTSTDSGYTGALQNALPTLPSSMTQADLEARRATVHPPKV